MILPFQVKNSRGVNGKVVLSIGRVWLFSLTSQDLSGAALPKSSEPASGDEFRLALPLIYRPAAQDNTQADIVETAKFYEDAPVKAKEVPRMISLSNAFGDTVMDSRIHDITNFLRRPILCRTGVWSLTDSSNAVLATMNMPADCLNKPLYREKLRGFYGFRAKMVIRVQINASRFQQGRLLIHYLPAVVTNNAVRLSTANSCLGTKTQQPSIDLDCTESEAVLEVPYISTSLYFNLLTGDNPYGNFYISVYSTLLSPSGLTNVDYSVWCHFEDVEVSYPTAALGTGPLMPQSGIGRRKKTPQDAEIDSVGLGPISGLANRVSVASGILSEIPLLSSVTAPVSWMAGILSRSALAMGFSKPTTLAPSEKRQLVMFSHMANIDGVDNSQKLSLTNTNAVEVLPGFAGSDIDEMSFAYLFRVPAYMRQFNWGSNLAAGTKLLSLRITPGDNPAEPMYQTISANNTPTNALTLKAKAPYQYIANTFTYWRGSINITFKFVKTEFHSGRLLVVFTPGRNIFENNCTFDNSQYCYREILDLRTSNEYSVKIPYVSTTPYLPMTAWSGNLAVYILNELRCPDTVSSAITVLVESSGGDDLDYICPAESPDKPILFAQSGGASAQTQPQLTTSEQTMFNISSVLSQVVGGVVGGLPLGILKPQSLGLGIADNGSATTQVEPDSIDHSYHDKDMNASRFIAGERILSTRQMIKKFAAWFTGIGASSPANIMAVFPQYLTLPYFKGGVQPVLDAGIRVDPISYFGSMFALQRGGQRLKLLSDMTPGVVTTAQLVYGPDLAISAAVINGPVNLTISPMLCTLENASQFGGLEVEIPYGSYTHAHSVGYAAVGFNTSVNKEGSTRVHIAQSSGLNKDLRLYRAAADDLSFGFFIGCPLLLTTFNYTQAA